MKSIKLGANAIKNKDYVVSVPVELVPAIRGYSQCNVTQHHKKDPNMGLLLSDDEYNNLPAEVDMANKISSGIFVAQEIFSPEDYFSQADSAFVGSLITFHSGDSANSVMGNLTLATSLTVDHEGDSSASITVDWESSNPAVISNSGVVTQPANNAPASSLDADGTGVSVVMTATIDMSKTTVNGAPEAIEQVKSWKASRSFTFKVLKAANPSA